MCSWLIEYFVATRLTDVVSKDKKKLNHIAESLHAEVLRKVWPQNPTFVQINGFWYFHKWNNLSHERFMNCDRCLKDFLLPLDERSLIFSKAVCTLDCLLVKLWSKFGIKLSSNNSCVLLQQLFLDVFTLSATFRERNTQPQCQNDYSVKSPFHNIFSIAIKGQTWIILVTKHPFSGNE